MTNKRIFFASYRLSGIPTLQEINRRTPSPIHQMPRYIFNTFPSRSKKLAASPPSICTWWNWNETGSVHLKSPLRYLPHITIGMGAVIHIPKANARFVSWGLISIFIVFLRIVICKL